MKKNLLIFIFFSFSFLISCATTSSSSEHSFLPEVRDATYKAYTDQYEKGYEVSFQTNKNEPKPCAIIFNKIKKPISQTEYRDGIYHVNVIAQTRLINDYKVISSTLPNGVLFYYNGKYYLRKVDFKSK